MAGHDGGDAAKAAWDQRLDDTAQAFTRPSFVIFRTLLTGWVLAPGRRTITAMIGVADPGATRAHDAYHRFVRAGRWSMTNLWKIAAVRVVALLCPTGVVPLDLDDSLWHKTGAKVNGAGSYRDAVRSTRNKIVYATGLNLVVVTLRVTPPWGGTPIGLPVAVRLHRKGGPTTHEQAVEMITELAAWLPHRCFLLCADGAYAPLIGRRLPRTQVISRLRRDAAVFEPAPPPTGKRGRPRTKGARLPDLATLAAQAPAKTWRRVTLDCRGRAVESMVWSRPVLWYGVDKHNLVLLVVVKDPSGRQPLDFFVCSDPEADAAGVASHYSGRWSIECVFRDAKQILGAENPQSWKGVGPERAAALSLWLMTAVWAWYIPTFGAAQTWKDRPWYRAKATPSFLDALAALRRVLWRDRITTMSASPTDQGKIIDGLVEVLASAA
ncbi:MAG: IS701 family transposase [Pseudonocardiaceae bacterium]